MAVSRPPSDSPATAATVLVSAASSAGHAHHQRMTARAGLYRRAGRERWQPAMQGVPDEEGTVVPVLASHRAEPDVVYVLSNQGVSRSSDTGLTGEPLALPWLAADRAHQQQALAIGTA
jgi:hypothetical protein